MQKKIIILSLCVLLVFAVITARNSTARDFKIGLSVWTGYPDSVKGFKDALAAEGLVEGKNLTYIVGKSGIDKAKQREIALDFKKRNLDLVYSLTTSGTTIMKMILPQTTPIVFSIVTYPADSGLIESFDYSGNNLVGTSNYVDLHHYVSLVKTILPNARTLAIFHRKGEPNSRIQAQNLIRLFKKAGITPIDLQPQNIEEMRKMALQTASRVDVFMTTTDTLCQGGGESALIDISLEKKIPIISSNKAGIIEGSTFGPVADFYTLGQMSGIMAVKILTKDIHPARIKSKIQDPPLVLVNKKNADALGIRIPFNELENLKFVE